MSRILIHDPDDGCHFLLEGGGQEVIACRDRNALVVAMTDRRPDVLVYVINDLNADLGLLGRVRRFAPSLPIILVGGPTDLAARRSIQELKPTYYGVLPLERSELLDAVRGALHRGSH